VAVGDRGHDRRKGANVEVKPERGRAASFLLFGYRHLKAARHPLDEGAVVIVFQLLLDWSEDDERPLPVASGRATHGRKITSEIVFDKFC
jgi:hypothetical protein